MRKETGSLAEFFVFLLRSETTLQRRAWPVRHVIDEDLRTTLDDGFAAGSLTHRLDGIVITGGEHKRDDVCRIGVLRAKFANELSTQRYRYWSH